MQPEIKTHEYNCVGNVVTKLAANAIRLDVAHVHRQKIAAQGAVIRKLSCGRLHWGLRTFNREGVSVEYGNDTEPAY